MRSFATLMKQETTLIRADLKTPRAAAVAGILFSVLLMSGLILFRLSVHADPLETGLWLKTDSKTVAFGLNLIPFAGIAFLWFIGCIVKDFYTAGKKFARQRTIRFVLHGALAAIIALLLEGLFEYNFGDSEILTLFLTVVALGYRAIELRSTPLEPAAQISIAKHGEIVTSREEMFAHRRWLLN